MLRRWRYFSGLAMSAGLALLMSAVGTVSVAADSNPGDMWTQPGTESAPASGHPQDVHLPYGDVALWGDKLENQSGTWILYHLPPPNPPGPGTQLATGTYTYSGPGSMKIATIPASTFANAPGPHFKVELTNDQTKWKTFWIESQAALVTTPNPTTAVVGATLNDSATLSGAIGPSGTIKFDLHNPGGTVAWTQTVDVNGNGPYSTTPGFSANAAGTWQWVATYSGDGGNKSVTTHLGDEPVTVAKASPTLVTTPNPATANVGDTLKDSATLSGGYHPTGTITFTLYDPSSTAVDTETLTVSGNGTYVTPTGYAATTPGGYHWTAEYAGDANNNLASSADEPVTVTSESQPAHPSLVTTPNPATAKVGGTLKDAATLSGGDHPTGHITFTLYDPSNHSVYTEQVTVNGNGDYSTAVGFASTAVGGWHWVAVYGGDGHNTTATSADEPVTVNQATPSLATAQNPSSAYIGQALHDSATLSGGYSPTGSITFKLYNPSNTVAYSESVTVTGNGTYPTAHSFAANVTGSWYWVATYGGDSNNATVTSANEPVTVSEEWHPAHPSIQTTPNPESVVVGGTLNDSATLSGGNSPTGHITFTLYDANGDVAYTQTVDVDGNGTYTTSPGQASDMVGTWHWKATYSGDEGNSSAGSEDEHVTVDPAQPAITTTASPTSTTGAAVLKDTATLSGGYHPTGTIKFTLYDPNGKSAYTETVNVAGNGSYSTPTGKSVNVAGTWHWKAEYSGDANNKAVASNLADEPVTVTGTSAVLAATGETPPAQGLALLLVAFGALGILSAYAWRRRTV